MLFFDWILLILVGVFFFWLFVFIQINMKSKAFGYQIIIHILLIIAAFIFLLLFLLITDRPENMSYSEYFPKLMEHIIKRTYEYRYLLIIVLLFGFIRGELKRQIKNSQYPIILKAKEFAQNHRAIVIFCSAFLLVMFNKKVIPYLIKLFS